MPVVSGGPWRSRLLRPCLLGLLAGLGGCIPMHQTQYLPEAGDAVYRRDDACDAAANTALIDYHGIEIRVGIWSRSHRGIRVIFGVPEGVTAQLAGDQAELVRHDGAGDVRTMLSMNRMQMRRAAAATEPMAGATDLKHYMFGLRSRAEPAEYEFRVQPWDVDYGDAGTLRLPDVLVNGVRYDGPTLNYRRSRVLGFVPLGC